MKCYLITVILSLLIIPNPVFLQVSKQDNLTKYENENDGAGNYRFRYDTSGGTSREETGTFSEDQNGGPPALVVQGRYSFVTPDGSKYTVTYVADERGFIPIITKVNVWKISSKRIQPNAISSLQGGGLG